ncbi:M50 family metallopeptidase [Patescibacteria group bacterium]|nr:M50 family metallopeptidase [Patescibacteria group bacterium]
MILIIVLAVASIVVLMVIHEFGHFIVAKKCGVRVEEFGIGYPPRIFGKKIKDTIYSINLIPLGAFVRIYGEEGGIEDYKSFSGLSFGKRMGIVLGGVISFWIAAIILFTIVFNIGVKVPVGDGDISGLTQVEILNVIPSSPAESAGFKSGDVLKQISSGLQTKEIKKTSDVSDFGASHKGESVSLLFERKGKPIEVEAVLTEEGKMGVVIERMYIVIEKQPWYLTPVKAIAFCIDLTSKALVALGQLVLGLVLGQGLMPGAEPAGPVGLTVFLARAVELGAGFFLYFIAAISVLLAIFNLLPIPALDGGKVLFLLIEKFRKKPISPKIEQGITAVFFFLLIAASIVVTIKYDIPRFSEFLKK